VTGIRTLRSAAALSALRSGPFRWLWLGRLASSATFQMSGVAQGWLVYELTGSAFALGWVGAGWSVATLALSLYGGVVCDRMEKRDILLWTRSIMGLNFLLLGLLISLGVVQLWHLAVSSLVTGAMFAFMMPAQQAIITDLVDRDTLLNANSLNAVGMGLMGIGSASLAGVIITFFGVDGVYYAMVLLYIMALYTLAHLPRTGVAETNGRSVWADLREGLGYLRHSKLLLTLLVLGLVRVIFASPYRTLMPSFSQEVMGFDAAGLGLLMAAPGLGGLVSSLAMAGLGDFQGKGKLLLVSGIALGLAIIAFAQVPVLAVVLPCLALVGAAENAGMVCDQTLVQMNCDDRYLGRVLSVYMMLWGLTPLGTLPAGLAADITGIVPVYVVQGLVVAAAFAGVLVFRPAMRRLP
jgi:MFS family permease